MFYSLKVLIEKKIQTLQEEKAPLHFLDTPTRHLHSWYAHGSVGSHCLPTVTGEVPPMIENAPTPRSLPADVATNESGRIWGDPHFEGGDGGKFDVQGEAGKTYNLLSDTGLLLNGRFDPYGKGKTVVGETGLTLSGPQGITKISVQSRPEGKVTINGRVMTPGESLPTADGGRVTLSSDGKKLTVHTGEGYTIEQSIKKSGPQGELEIRVKTPSRGVARDGRLPSGLLGQTFDPDKLGRNSQDPQGNGAIQGQVEDYEVPAGVFGDPSPQVAPHPIHVFGFHQFLKELGFSANTPLRYPSQNPLTFESVNWQTEIQQSYLNDILRDSSRQAKQQVFSQNQKINRLTHLLMLILRSGNISLAMMIFAHLEAKEANELNRTLVGKMQELQQQKRQLSSQITGQKNDAEGMKNYQAIKIEIDSVNDDISVLQTFIRDVAQNKQQALELTNAFLTQEHETSMSIIRSFGR